MCSAPLRNRSSRIYFMRTCLISLTLLNWCIGTTPTEVYTNCKRSIRGLEGSISTLRTWDRPAVRYHVVNQMRKELNELRIQCRDSLINAAGAIRASSEVIGRELDSTQGIIIAARQSLMDMGMGFLGYIGSTAMTTARLEEAGTLVNRWLVLATEDFATAAFTETFTLLEVDLTSFMETDIPPGDETVAQALLDQLTDGLEETWDIDSIPRLRELRTSLNASQEQLALANEYISELSSQITPY